ncbi:hypothetical protein [Aquirufa lenticrescens]|uniref:hypothetical protein n=1 Tax=Aquirufa lenticrescens TaxID=2696560 RepID=UPI001CAA5AF0|nr:hypothetical protein [Aquirufa lenticrescens]UAJ14002.1 hypothetical protein G9X62_05300 [Aquirufa lenticrescens]
MKKIVFFFLISVSVFAQTGIGTNTPHASAKLDVSATNKGFLPPRVTLTGISDNSTIASPATGLLVYNTGDNVGLPAGYYFWNGNAWATIATAGGSGSFASSFVRGSRTANQSVAVDGAVTFTRVDNTSGQDISLNTTNGKITLAPGNTYRLMAAVPNFSGNRPAFMWYNETSTSYIGSASNAYSPTDGASGAGAFGGIAEVIITPNVSTVLSFRLLSSLNSGAVTVGGLGDFSASGSYPWFEAQVISGNSPVTGQSVDYVSVGTIYQTTVGVNRDLIFTTNNGGNIPYNTTTGIFTLSANKTYLFQAQIRANTPSADGSYIEYGFVDATTNSLLVDGTQTITTSTTSTSGFGSNPVVNFIYTPTANQTVKLRTIGATRGTQLVLAGTANITQIGSSAIINPWILSGTNTYNTTGNVGIGTNAPSEKLEVSGNVKANNFIGTASSSKLFLLEAYANVSYTLPGAYTYDLCRYSVVNNTVNVPSSWFNTSTYTFTPQKAGYWEISASYDVYRNGEASMVIYKNGANVGVVGSISAVTLIVNRVIYLNGSTDYINIYNVGFNANARGQGAATSWFQARWLGE